MLSNLVLDNTIINITLFIPHTKKKEKKNICKFYEFLECFGLIALV